MGKSKLTLEEARRETPRHWRDVERGYQGYRDTRMQVTLPRLKCLEQEGQPQSRSSVKLDR